MTEEVLVDETMKGEDDAELRVYEAGYLILPTVKDEDIEGVVASIRSIIEKEGGSFISEGAPVSMKLAYTMHVSISGKWNPYDRASFGWIKFEVTGAGAKALQEALESNDNILRSIVFKTVKEDTRASAKKGVLREVKRTDTIKSQPSKGADAATEGEVSEEVLDKTLDDLIKE